MVIRLNNNKCLQDVQGKRITVVKSHKQRRIEARSQQKYHKKDWVK